MRRWWLFLAISCTGYLFPGEWIGRTNEEFSNPATDGLGQPRVLGTTFPLSVSLDLDRDGDLDEIKVHRGTKHGLIESSCRRSTNRLASVWKSTLPLGSDGAVTGIFVGRVSKDRWPGLIVELSVLPYLAYFSGRGNATFDGKPEFLSRRFPLRYYRPARRIEPYVSLLDVLDWDGDGFEDVITIVLDAGVGMNGRVQSHRHGIYVLFGGKRWRKDAVEVLDLRQLGRQAAVLAVRDFDGDGTVEILLDVEQLRGETIRTHELLFLRKHKRITQEATWTLVESQLEPYVRRDLNGDGIQDVVLADYARKHFLLLQTNRRGGRGFSFSLQRITMPPEAYGSNGKNVSLFFDDLNGDALLDIFTVSAAHNQIHMILRRPEGEAQPALAYLPRLPKAADVSGAGWFDKAVWFGDLDQDGVQEILVLTNQVLNPDFVPPRGAQNKPADPASKIRTALLDGDEQRYYAPYFRLLVYRIREAAVALVATFNTRIPAATFYPGRIVLRNPDPTLPGELVLEVVSRASGRSVHGVLPIMGRLPPAPQRSEEDAADRSKSREKEENEQDKADPPPVKEAPATPEQH